MMICISKKNHIGDIIYKSLINIIAAILSANRTASGDENRCWWYKLEL